MEMKDIIAKVNYFSKLARERELTEAEKEERQKYRQMYLEQFKAQVRGHLDNIKIVDGEVKNDSKFKII
ncbi:MAG: DUF896 domain-containing protein [Fusobacterium mortiferum]|jgi:uncharacterized protein YnzC (UPF0291/DUF896 family)|uniref:DUF896 domain-containing protein n=1 Tax=Fusobacterium TaxID=848 RepID=UPI0012B20838|nr:MULTISPECIES: DUF896 domain-containing protein [Fusobacterium]MCF2628865.1 DUF896 domain-containing protein [Fusobacterium mortiferum]MCI7187638.1 DUF896 domain-containing protein [Fusobacterium mortiferum]MDD7262570.1 DUF896 domain-containing protein [Fusobacterium mortiferum]MDY4800091.1 DUF896 domain-containing protein [Fusobacterium mortiferum]MDY5981216.1 DUF896 domain-containing protein [Fusobacterium mortiferum]